MKRNLIAVMGQCEGAGGARAQAGDGRSEDHRAAYARFQRANLQHATPVVYSIIANSAPADVMNDVAAQADEPHVLSGPDKFRNTDLEKILKDKGITTVIAVGTASNGAVLYTASGAAFRGLNVIIPVDGMSAADPYGEYSTVFTFMNAPTVSAKTTLTRSDMIKF